MLSSSPARVGNGVIQLAEDDTSDTLGSLDSLNMGNVIWRGAILSLKWIIINMVRKYTRFFVMYLIGYKFIHLVWKLI